MPEYHGVDVKNQMSVCYKQSPTNWSEYNNVLSFSKSIIMSISGILTSKYIELLGLSEKEAEERFVFYKNSSSLNESDVVVFKSCFINDPTQEVEDDKNQWCLKIDGSGTYCVISSGAVSQFNIDTGSHSPNTMTCTSYINNASIVSGGYTRIIVYDRGIGILTTRDSSVNSGMGFFFIQRPVNKINGKTCLCHDYPVFSMFSGVAETGLSKSVKGGLVRGNNGGVDVLPYGGVPDLSTIDSIHHIIHPVLGNPSSIGVSEDGEYILSIVSGFACNGKYYVNYEFDTMIPVSPVAFNSDVEINIYGDGIRKYTLFAPHFTGNTSKRILYQTSGKGVVKLGV